MNKKFQQFVPICLIIAVIMSVFAIIMISKPKIEEYQTVTAKVAKNNEQRRRLEEQIKKAEDSKQSEEIKLKALKPIYKSTIKLEDESLGVFGNMFDDVIRIAQSNGLLIRSVEYNMHPTNDPLYTASSNNYNACELKFFFIGTYIQLNDFIHDLTQNFQYLISLSSLDVQVFQDNTDYLLINQTITLYSEKPSSRPSTSRRSK